MEENVNGCFFSEHSVLTEKKSQHRKRSSLKFYTQCLN